MSSHLPRALFGSLCALGVLVLTHLVPTVGVQAQQAPSPATNLRIIDESEVPPPPPPPPTGEEWPMAGGNPQRTSNSSTDVSAVSGVTWYRPIEAFITGATQLVTSGGRVYVATARGLVVLDAEDGDLVCRFDPDLPVATPTVHQGAVYVPGYDRTLYSLGAGNCSLNWAFTGASAGFSANPVVTGGRVYLGSRDGRFYAVNASNGSLAWSYATGGPIMQSAAYDNGVLYVASMDMYGYALNASSGSLVWRTPQKLPGDQYSVWWPVVHGNYVVWAAGSGYRHNSSPGSLDVGPEGADYGTFFGVPSGSVTAGTVIASSNGSHGWPAGSTVMSTTTGQADHTLQGWVDTYPARRVYAIVNKSNGVESFYLPWLESGQNESGQMHPPVSDGDALYFNGAYERNGSNIPRSRPMAWKEGTSWLRLGGNISFAIDEPLVLSMTNGHLMAVLCCDREARIVSPISRTFWSYGTNELDGILPAQGAPGAYDPMWAFYDGKDFLDRLGGYYNGNTSSRNGVYHNHGMQNPLVPHAYTNASNQRVERLFVHRSNTIIAVGPTESETPRPLITINPNPPNRAPSLSRSALEARLEDEVQRMVDLYLANGVNGFLRPAYIRDGGRISNTIAMPEDDVYFERPLDTLYTLALAHPHLPGTLQGQLLSYLADYWDRYFETNLVNTIGWNTGTPRESMVYPPEVANRMTQIGDSAGGSMSQRVFLAAWRYAELVPSEAESIYNRVRPLLISPPPPNLDVVRGPATYNDYIAGYQGFLNLYDLVGTDPAPSLRASVAGHLQNLVDTRVTNFAKDHPWEGSVDNPNGIRINNYARRYNCTRNFLYMTPALGGFMRSSAQSGLIQSAVDEYTYLCPSWFMARPSDSFQEASAHHIYDSHSLFLAKAYVRNDSRSELSKWIDVPWMLGDLYYLQNVIAALQASE